MRVKLLWQEGHLHSCAQGRDTEITSLSITSSLPCHHLPLPCLTTLCWRAWDVQVEQNLQGCRQRNPQAPRPHNLPVWHRETQGSCNSDGIQLGGTSHGVSNLWRTQHPFNPNFLATFPSISPLAEVLKRYRLPKTPNSGLLLKHPAFLLLVPLWNSLWNSWIFPLFLSPLCILYLFISFMSLHLSAGSQMVCEDKPLIPSIHQRNPSQASFTSQGWFYPGADPWVVCKDKSLIPFRMNTLCPDPGELRWTLWVSWSRWKELRRIMLSCPCPAAPALSPLSTLTGRDVSYFNESSWLLPLGFQAGVQPMNIFQLVFWRRFLYWLTIADFPWAILFLQQVLEVKESNAAGIAMKHELKQDSAWQQLRAGSAPAVSSQSSELPEPWPAGSQPSLSYYGTEHGWVCPQSWDFINPNPRVRCSSCPTCCQHTDSSSPTPPNPHK